MSDRYWQSGEVFKRLRLDRENAVILGVCAGLADFFKINVSIARLLVLIAVVFLTVPTLIVYFTMALLLRDKPLRYHGYRPESKFWSCAGERRQASD